MEVADKEASKEVAIEEAPAVGIDWGTTNSCLAIWENGKVVVVPNSSGETTTPSVVRFGSHGYCVGNRGDIGEVSICSEIFNSKRILGTNFKEAKAMTENSPLILVDDGKNRPKYEVDFKGEKYSVYPEQIAALILRKLKQDAEIYLRKAVKKAVLTIPAYFSDSQKQSIKVAAELANIEVLKIIPEPVAAILCFAKNTCPTEERNVLVYDLGGGTFDVSIVNIDTIGFYETRATGGNTCLGGINFDNALYEYCMKELKKDLFDISEQSADIRQSLYQKCQMVKTELSTQEYSDVNIKCGVDEYVVPISRKLYESLIVEEVKETIECLKFAITDAGMEESEISEIALVGGSTLTPLIRTSLVNSFGDKLNTSAKPHEAVAIGAAVLAASLEKRDGLTPLIVRNSTPLSIGVLSKGKINKVVTRNTVYPNIIKCKGKTMLDNQKKCYIGIYEGEHDHPAHNKKLGSMSLEGIQIAPAGIAKIDIEFKIDSNGELTVKAIDPKTNATESIVIQKPHTFTKEEIKMMSDDLIGLDSNKKAKRYSTKNASKNVSQVDLEASQEVDECKMRSVYGSLGNTAYRPIDLSIDVPKELELNENV